MSYNATPQPCNLCNLCNLSAAVVFRTCVKGLDLMQKSADAKMRRYGKHLGGYPVTNQCTCTLFSPDSRWVRDRAKCKKLLRRQVVGLFCRGSLANKRKRKAHA